MVASTIRSAFEYQGQKCSACSRMYVPESLWPQVKEGLIETQKSLKMGPATDPESFMSAVIDKKAFQRISGYIDGAKASPNCSIVAGGGYDDSVGYFVEPTIVQVNSPEEKIFKEEIFGPVVSVHHKYKRFGKGFTSVCIPHPDADYDGHEFGWINIFDPYNKNAKAVGVGYFRHLRRTETQWRRDSFDRDLQKVYYL